MLVSRASSSRSSRWRWFSPGLALRSGRGRRGRGARAGARWGSRGSASRDYSAKSESPAARRKRLAKLQNEERIHTQGLILSGKIFNSASVSVFSSSFSVQFQFQLMLRVALPLPPQEAQVQE